MRSWLLLAMLPATVVVAVCAPIRHYEAVQVLHDLAAGEGASLLKRYP